MSRRPLTVPTEPERRIKQDPWGLALALNVIEYDFGAFTKTVAEGLAAIGRPGLGEITTWVSKQAPGNLGVAKKVRASHKRSAF
jgi:hypothetical protein